MLALIELYQPAGRHCSTCAIEHSVDQKSWKLTTQVNSLRTSVAYGPRHQIKARYMQVRVTRCCCPACMSHVIADSLGTSSRWL